MPRMRDRNGRQIRSPVTAFSRRKVMILGLILALNNLSIWMVFSFLPDITKHFYPNLSLVELGYKAGYLGAAFSSGSIFGNIFWGIVADKYGRRLALLSGLGGTIAAVIIFGFSPTFNIAVGARFLWGFLNGNIGVSKTYIGELLDDSNNPRGMTLYGTIGGTGRFIGPIVGIYLISPAGRYHLFVGTLFEKFPLALPSSMVALSCAIVLLFAYFELQETFKLRQKRVNSGMGAISYNRDGKTVRRGTAEYSRISGTDIDTEPDIENDLDGSIGLHGRPMKSIEYGQVFTLNHDFELEKAKAKGGMKSSKGSKKSLALALPLLSLTLRNQEADDCNGDDDRTVVTQASTTSTALIEQSLPSHFRIQPNLHTSDEQLNTIGHLNVSVTEYPSTSIASDDCIIGGTLLGIDPQESSLFPYNQDLTHVLGTENGMKVLEPIDVSCVPVDFMSALNTCEKRVGRDSDANGRESDRASHGKWILDVPSDASKKKDLESHLANNTSSQPQSQSPSRRVSFSSLVTVKVIGSSSLGIGQLKHVRPDDSPVRDFDGFKGQGQVRSAYPHMDNTATIGLRNGISAPSALSSSSASHTRYSNGSEFNTSLAARHGSLSQRVRYLLCKRQILVTTLMYGANGLVQLLFTEMASLWLVAPLDKGGFNLNRSSLTAAAVVSAVLAIALQLSLYPLFAETYGVLYTYRLGCYLFGVAMFSLPIIYFLKGQREPSHAVWIVLVIVLTGIGVAIMFTLVSVFILINNSCYSHERATVNGIGQVFVSIGRAAAPFLVAQMIAFNGPDGSTDWLFNYFILGTISLLNARLALTLPRSIERRRREPREPRYAYSTSGAYCDDDYAELEDLIATGDLPLGSASQEADMSYPAHTVVSATGGKSKTLNSDNKEYNADSIAPFMDV